MPSEIKSILKERKILILGFGQEGQSTYAMIRKWFPGMPLGIADRNINAWKAHFRNEGTDRVILHCGEDYLDFCQDYNLIIKSPGIPYHLIEEKCDGAEITSQTDLFLKAFAERVTGVTGTKGKSTTCSLIQHIMNSSGRKAILAGNIGVPPLNLAEEIGDDSEVIFEMSSHQLERISLAPHIAVILNVFPEHLDHYKDFTAYKMAKFNISRMQPDGGKLIYNRDDKIIDELVKEEGYRKVLLPYSTIDPGARAFYDGIQIICRDDAGKNHTFPVSTAHDLPGEHNMMNVMAAILVCIEKQIPDESILEGLQSYKRLAHRLEFAGTYGGIHFYDDSIATIPEACIGALNTLERVDLLILGGYDRGLDYVSLYRKLMEMPALKVVFMGEAGKRMHKEWLEFSGDENGAYLVDQLDEAFTVIKATLVPGDVCLLSPAAASYGMFRNFEERGQVFKKMATTL